MIKDLSSDELLKLSSVLSDIKYLVLYAKTRESVVYPSDKDLNSLLSESRLTSEEQRFYVFTLQAEGAIKVLYEHSFGKKNTPYRWTLEGIMPRLNELESEIKGLFVENSKGSVFDMYPDPARDVPVEVIISDLESRYQEIKNEKRNDLFFLKIAGYGQYLNEHESINQILTPLYEQSEKDRADFRVAWQIFFKKWKPLAKELIETAEMMGIKDDGPLENEITEILGRLNMPEPAYYVDELDGYYRPYSRLIEKVIKHGKKDLIANTHLENNQDSETKFDSEHYRAQVEWGKYKNKRTISTWWAHYQILMTNLGILGEKNQRQYFQPKNRILDAIYNYEFEQISHGIDHTTVYLKRRNFEEWITKLHSYLIPRLWGLPKNQETKSEVDEKTLVNRQKGEPIQIQIVSGDIKGKMEIEGLQDGLKAITQIKKEDKKNKFPYKLPAGTTWENFTIKFENDENIFIQVKQFKQTTNYMEMGFVGKGNNPNPSEAWIFLKVLAEVHGELTLKDPKSRDKYKKQKELLTKALQSYFSLDYDPFYPYRTSSEKSGNSYKIKITLIPPPDQKEKANTNKVSEDKLGIKEYLDEQNPQVYEDE